ncbi:interferon-induced transmembrane protein 1-like [Pelodytes ibericus]
MENDNYIQQLTEPLVMDSTVPSDKGYKALNTEAIPLQNVCTQQPQSTVVTISSHDPPLKDYLLFSVFNIMCINLCCLGFLALVFAIKSRDRKLLGDWSGAKTYGSTSRAINIATAVLTALFFIIMIYVLLTNLPPLPSLMHKLNAIVSGN